MAEHKSLEQLTIVSSMVIDGTSVYACKGEKKAQTKSNGKKLKTYFVNAIFSKSIVSLLYAPSIVFVYVQVCVCVIHEIRE